MFVINMYRDPSIKDIERASREDGKESNVVVSGPKQKVKYCKDCLSSFTFNTSLLDFLIEEWQQDCYVLVLNGHVLFAIYDRW